MGAPTTDVGFNAKTMQLLKAYFPYVVCVALFYYIIKQDTRMEKMVDDRFTSMNAAIGYWREAYKSSAETIQLHYITEKETKKQTNEKP